MSGSKRYGSSSSYSSYSPPVPDRWLKCPRKSFTTITDKFVAFKTPLDSKYDDQVPLVNRFNTEMLFSSMSNMKVSIGLWIDLTKTSRFYNKSEIEDMECSYVKLPCAGHKQPPTREQAQLFIDICSKFVAKNPLQCIGVHCTHGFNRTGFMIATYLIEVLDFDVTSAIAQFATARPPGIYKQDYIVELFQRYSDEEPILAPELPDWCLESEEDNHHSNSNQRDSSTRLKHEFRDQDTNDHQDHEIHNKRSRIEINNRNPVFMEGVSGVTAIFDQPRLTSIQRRAQDLCKWKKSGFPGSQPVSMDIQNIKLLHTKPYRVTWKADGTRYMMFIQGENEIYFIDRDNSVFEVEGLTFLHRKNLDHHLKDTLLDGEMIIDKVDGQNIPRYLVYDVVAFEGFDIGKQPFFPNRLTLIEVDIIKPRHQAIMCGRLDKAQEPFSIRSKQFYDINASDKLLGNFSKNLSHEPDGLIFQPSNDPYVAGTCPEVMKWKPLELNSVDFRLKIVTEGGTGMLESKVGYLYVGGKHDPFARMKYTKELKNMDGKIIECKFENGNWKFMRERTDKSFPNALKTAMDIRHKRETMNTTFKKRFLEMGVSVKHFIRSFSTSNVNNGKRNFKNFILYNRGTNQFKKQQQENPNKDFQISDYGIRETTVKVGRKFVTIQEKIPEIIVPDLDDFDLKPYVSYRVPEITQSEFSAQDLFNAVYRKKIIDDFKNNKLKENGEPIEPSEEESLTPEQAKMKARQTGSDLFSQGR